ncbi:MAG: protein-glutamate O-methyltransferase CheR [Thermodesulfobacteriota bacterium]
MHFDEFLREVTPLLGLQWRPFQRRGIRRKVEHRIAQVGLSKFEDYLLKIKNDPEEQSHLSKFLAVTISRFFRDREVFSTIENFLIPTIIKNRNEGHLKIWSIGCASGEEPYSICLLWKERFEKTWPQIHLSILATDVNENLIERAKEGKYKKSSVKEVPEEVLRDFFKIDNGFYVLDRAIREGVEFRKHHIINEEPFSGMDMVFCRNLAFTYFSKECQVDVLKKIALSLKDKGCLVIGKDEALPLVYPTLFVPIFLTEKIYQKFNPNYTASSK